MTQTDYYFGSGHQGVPDPHADSLGGQFPHQRGDGYNYWYGALHAKAKMGIFSLNATGVIQEGDLSINADKDLSGWAFPGESFRQLGQTEAHGNLTMLSGDDGSDDNEDGRFRTPKEGGSGWFFRAATS